MNKILIIMSFNYQKLHAELEGNALLVTPLPFLLFFSVTSLHLYHNGNE